MAKKTKTRKTILFDEVNAEKKDWRVDDLHTITQYPSKSNKWYILDCQPYDLICHSVRAASNHQTSKTHRVSGQFDQAVEALGIQVVDCGKAQAKRNNVARDEALKQGYNYERTLAQLQGRRASNGIPHRRSTTSHGR